jgi:glutamate/tyrosine decarboxylase-like PLP-dependent enzyme
LVGDSTLPSIVGYIAALIYNTNTVSNALSQATTPMEIEVGQQMCDMLGYNLQNDPALWGHLTGGGTIANIEGIWSSQNVRFYPFALQRTMQEIPNISKDISNYQVHVQPIIVLIALLNRKI